MKFAHVHFTYDLPTNQASTTLAVTIAVSLSKVAWSTVSAIVPVTDRMRTAYIGGTYDLGANHPVLALTIKITIPLPCTAWAAVSAVVPMTNRMRAYSRSLAYVNLTGNLGTRQSVLTFTIAIAVTFSF